MMKKLKINYNYPPVPGMSREAAFCKSVMPKNKNLFFKILQKS